MVRPRWLSAQRVTASRLWHHWDRAVAFWAGLNLVLVLFDITYIPLRTFWLQRNLTPLPPLPVVVPLKALPDITPYYDPVKGIEPHRETQAYLEAFERLDQQLLTAAGTAAETPLLRQQAELTVAMIHENPFAASGNSGTLEKIKNRLRQRAGEDSAKQAAERLLSAAWLKQRSWSEERRFWRQQVLPLVATSYWRAIDDNGRPIDHFWRLDLLLFQGVFALDILLRMVRLRRRFPGLSWRDALLRRWLDLPLLLPFWRLLRLLPVVERLSRAGLINVEPLRAAVSRAVVSLLALELFEVLALQLVDGTQSLVCSPMWPRWIRGLRSHQSVAVQEDQQMLDLMRLWGPLVLEQITPRLAPELQSLLGHALQQQLRDVPGGLMVPSGLSRQLAAGLVERLLDVSRSTAQRLSREDERQNELLQRAVDRFWDELASALEQEGRLEQTQQLLCALLQQIKLNYVAQINRAGIGALMDELDEITLPLHTALQPPTPGV